MLSPDAERRVGRVMADTGAVMVYADGHDDPHIDIRPGSVRDTFDFGPVVWLDSAAIPGERMEKIQAGDPVEWYTFWLDMLHDGKAFHLPEPLYSFQASESGEDAFAYVDASHREMQLRLEEAFTSRLAEWGALVDTDRLREAPLDDDGADWPVEASVVIPVRNRVRTIADAVESALRQETDFPMTVIVVENHSTDGTSDILRELDSRHGERLVVVTPQDTTLGIGGCWNLALRHPMCGRFAIQLDSDDIYSSLTTVQRIVDCFRTTRAAMVVGSYRLTDFSLNTIPPGLIDHREWTDTNGPNNLLRVNGMGAPRAFFTPVAREVGFPDTSYGEDYAMALRVSRTWRIARIFDELYLCRRWEGNSDASPGKETLNRFNAYKDTLRTMELEARIRANKQVAP